MAKVQLFKGFRSTFFDKFSGQSAQLRELASPSSFTIANSDQSFTQTFEGNFELTQKGRVKSGTITAFSISINGEPAWSVSDVLITVEQYNNLFKVSPQNAFDQLFGSADQFDGSESSDTLFSYAGADSIDGNQGNDLIDAGIDDDQLFGDAGNDTLKGNSGADLLQGGIGDDQLLGEIGNDQLDGGSGEDILDGGLGSDVLNGGTQADLLTGGVDLNTFITNIGASPEFTAIDFGTNEELILRATNGVDLITDFKTGDIISSQGSEYLLPDSEDFSQGFFESNNGVFIAGDWTPNGTASGLNRGSFTISFTGPDVLFFIPPSGADFFFDSETLASDLGSQLFVLTDANPVNSPQPV